MESMNPQHVLAASTMAFFFFCLPLTPLSTRTCTTHSHRCCARRGGLQQRHDPCRGFEAAGAGPATTGREERQRQGEALATRSEGEREIARTPSAGQSDTPRGCAVSGVTPTASLFFLSRAAYCYTQYTNISLNRLLQLSSYSLDMYRVTSCITILIVLRKSEQIYSEPCKSSPP